MNQDYTNPMKNQQSTKSPGKWRQVWEEHNGPIPKGMHIHHIIPRSEGGTDDIENLMMVTPEEHYDIHFERGDYGACALLADGIDRVAPTTPVCQFTKSGYKINTFNSQHEAEEITGVPQRSISMCVRDKQDSAGGFQWFYEHDVHDVDIVPAIKDVKPKSTGLNTNPVCCLDLHTLLVYKSKGLMAKDIYKEEWYNGIQNRAEFKRRRFDITKEEYNILKEL